jgi:hypothetical protein
MSKFSIAIDEFMAMARYFLNAFAVVNCILHKLTCKYFIAATCIAYDRTDHNHYRSLLKAGVESFF